jgi:hypothetical protein
MSYSADRNRKQRSELPATSFSRSINKISYDKRARTFHDDGDDFQLSSNTPPAVTSSGTKRSRENVDLDNQRNRLQLSGSHLDIQKRNRLETDHKSAIPKQKLLRLSSTSKSTKEGSLPRVPSSGGNMRALSYIKKGPSNSLAGASREQHHDLFAASIKTKIKPSNPFSIPGSNTMRSDVLNLPRPRKSRRRQDNEPLKSTDEIKARMTSVSALNHSADALKSKYTMCCPCNKSISKRS